MSNQAFRHYSINAYRQHVQQHEAITDALDFVREAVGRRALEALLTEEVKDLNE